MWKKILSFFHRKHKLMLNFYDPEYDDLMNFFKQIIYINKIKDAIQDESMPSDYAIGLMESFAQIYISAANKIGMSRKKKPLDITRVNLQRFEKEMRQAGATMADVESYDQETKDILYEMHNVRRETSYNQIVARTYVRTLKTIMNFSNDMYDILKVKSEEYRVRYGVSLMHFLNSLDNSMVLYDRIGAWLKEDCDAIEKYKVGLGKRVAKHTRKLEHIKIDRIYIAPVDQSNQPNQ